MEVPSALFHSNRSWRGSRNDRLAGTVQRRTDRRQARRCQMAREGSIVARDHERGEQRGDHGGRDLTREPSESGTELGAGGKHYIDPVRGKGMAPNWRPLCGRKLIKAAPY